MFAQARLSPCSSYIRRGCQTHARIQEVFSGGGSNFEIFFQVNEWIQIPQKLDHHRPASETPFKWRFAGVPMMAQH